jgi:hypothetical protein
MSRCVPLLAAIMLLVLLVKVQSRELAELSA